MDTAYFLQQLINGVTLGSVYGLIAIGYTMVYGIIGMINFAHGDIFMVGAFIALISFILFALTSIALPIVLFLTLLFVLLFNMFFSKDSTMDCISLLILISIPVTAYYAWLLFFKLHIRCMGCVRIQIYNLLIVGAYLVIISGS